MLLKLRQILNLLSLRARGLQVAIAVVRSLELLMLFGSTWMAARAHVVGAIAALAIGSTLYIVRQLLRAWLTQLTRKAIFNALAESLLQADLLTLPANAGHEAEPLVFAGAFEAIRLMSTISPVLLGELGASAVLGVVIACGVSAQWIAALTAGLVVVGVVFVLGHRVTRTHWHDETQNLQEMTDGMICAFRGRLELVSSGYAAAFLAAQSDRVDRWSRSALQSGASATLTWRGAWLLGATGAASLLALGTSVFPIEGFAINENWQTILRLAGAAPAFIGGARDQMELARACPRLQPLLDALFAPRSRLAHQPSHAPPALPATFQCRNVSFVYPTGHLAIEHLDFTWTPGKLLVLAGPNGSGKSTALRLLLGLGQPTRGSIEVGGIDIARLDIGSWRRQISFVPQQVFSPDAFTVRNIMKLVTPASDEIIVEALQRVDIWDSLRARSPQAPLDLLVSSLSAGQRQRVWLARALAAETSLWLLDEPDADLDTAGVELLLTLIRSDSRRSAIVATHRREIIAAADQVVWMAKGSGETSASAASAQR